MLITHHISAQPQLHLHIASMDWAKMIARRDDKHLSVGIWCALYVWGLTIAKNTWFTWYLLLVILHDDHLVQLYEFSEMKNKIYRRTWACASDKTLSPAKFCYPFVITITCVHQRHCGDVIKGAIASQITSLIIVYSTVYSDADQRKHQSSASRAFVWGIHRGPVNSPHKWPVTRKMFPFDDVIMILKCYHLKHRSMIIECRYDTVVRSNITWYSIQHITNKRRMLVRHWTEHIAFGGKVWSVILQWRQNEHDGVSNHLRLDCLLNRLLRRRWKETKKAPRHWPLWVESTSHQWIPLTKGH